MFTFFSWREDPFLARTASFSRLHDDKVIHTILHKNPLDDWARCRELYLTKQNIYKRQTSKPRGRFEPAIPASERPQIHTLDRATTGIVLRSLMNLLFKSLYRILCTYHRYHMHVIANQTSASFILWSYSSLAVLYHRSCREICLLSWIDCSTKHLITLLHNSFVSVNKKKIKVLKLFKLQVLQIICVLHIIVRYCWFAKGINYKIPICNAWVRTNLTMPILQLLALELKTDKVC
jgi:hypothetical protein